MSDNLIILADRIKQLTQTTGISNFSLEADTVNGFSNFNTIYSDGDVLFYAATDGLDYEVGSGIFNTGVLDTIIRMPFRSSNNNSKVAFGDGFKEIYVTYPATHSVYIGSGIEPLNFPQASGIAFWSSSNILNYDSDVIWDTDTKRLGIQKANPQYSIDIGGLSADSSISASGFYVGVDGVVFPASSPYAGGSQTMHFLPNTLDAQALADGLISEETGTDAVFSLDGDVNQIILFKKQPQGTFLAGPSNNSCGPDNDGPCADEYPTFKVLTLNDIPDLSSLYGSFADIEEVSGVLNTAILQSGIASLDYTTAVSGLLFSDIATASGELRSTINDLIPTFDITDNDNEFIFNGYGTNGDFNPNIRLSKGKTYKFNISTPDYPFYICSSLPLDLLSNPTNVYNDGVSQQGVVNGEILFTVPQDAPEYLYYASNMSSTMSGVIFTSDLSKDIELSDVDSASDDSVVIWDSSDYSYKNMSLQNLLYAPSGNSYIKYSTVSSSNASGGVGQVSFDDDWAYFKTNVGWKRIKIRTFDTTTTTSTSTTWPPNCTTLEPCPANEFRTITGVVSGGTYNGCPIYSDCATTTTTTTIAPTTTTMAPLPITNYVYTWGYNGNNQLGYSTTELFSGTPTRLELGNIDKISASDYHVLAIDSYSHLYAWGWNNQGQIGDGTKVDATTPVQIGNQKWSAIAAGDYHSAGISNGRLYTWGYNINGQLGNGTRIGHTTPTQVGNLNSWVKVFCGTSHTLAINSIGELWAWGSNEYGQVGNGSFIDVLSPVKIGAGYLWETISAYMHTMGITKEGELLVWGRNTDGQLGITGTTIEVNDQGVETVKLDEVSSTANKSTPTPVSKTTTTEISLGSLTTLEGTRDNWISVGAGYKHSLAVNQAGELYVCGTNSYGSMGLPASVSSIPAMYRITNERNWFNVAAGNYHSIAISAAGALYAFGRNNYGQLGNENQTDQNEVTLISTDYDWDFPSAGYDFTAIIGKAKMGVALDTTITIADGQTSVSQDGITFAGTAGDELSYNLPESTAGTPSNAILQIGGTAVAQVTFPSPYSDQPARFTRDGASYDFTLTAGVINL